MANYLWTLREQSEQLQSSQTWHSSWKASTPARSNFRREKSPLLAPRCLISNFNTMKPNSFRKQSPHHVLFYSVNVSPPLWRPHQYLHLLISIIQNLVLTFDHQEEQIANWKVYLYARSQEVHSKTSDWAHEFHPSPSHTSGPLSWSVHFSWYQLAVMYLSFKVFGATGTKYLLHIRSILHQIYRRCFNSLIHDFAVLNALTHRSTTSGPGLVNSMTMTVI